MHDNILYTPLQMSLQYFIVIVRCYTCAAAAACVDMKP